MSYVSQICILSSKNDVSMLQSKHVAKILSEYDCGFEKTLCIAQKNIIGHHFGMLTVLKEMDWGDATKVVITQTYCDVKHDKVFERKPHYKQYLCQCECGNQIILESRNLKSMTSCGCRMKKNLYLTGMRFGKLIVLNKVDWKASKTIDVKR